MQLNQRRRFTAAAILALFSLSAGTAFGQAERANAGTGPGNAALAQFRGTLQDADRKLKTIEQLFAQLEGMKTIGNNFGDALNDPISQYAMAMSAAFDTAIQQTELAARTQGKEGSTGLVKPFEDLAQQHERGWKSIDDRGRAIVNRVKDGGVLIEKSLLEQATPQDRDEFLRNLSPQGAKEVGQKYPDLFKGKPSSPPKSSSASEPNDSYRMARTRQWPVLEKISDLLIRPAQAAIALTVYSACHNSDGTSLTAAQWATCLQVTQTAITQKAQAQNTYNSCAGAAHGGGDKHWKHLHWKFTMLTTCGAALVFRLA